MSKAVPRVPAAAPRAAAKAVIVGGRAVVCGSIAGALAGQGIRVERAPAIALAPAAGAAASARVSAAAVPSADLYIVNMVGENLPLERYHQTIEKIKSAEPESKVVLVGYPITAVSVARAVAAGVDEFIWDPEIKSPKILTRRICRLVEEILAEKSEVEESDVKRVRETPRAPASEAEQKAAIARVERELAKSSTTTGRPQLLTDVLGIKVPELRSSSGRLDAKKIAGRLRISLSQLEDAVGVSRQALHKNADSEKAQAGLDPIARVIDVMDRVFDPEQAPMWLNARNDALKGKTPLETILAGRAESIARIFESAAAGIID